MSYIDQFYFAKDIQGCHNYVKNVAERLLQIQQPIVRDALRALHPITQLWKKSRSTGSIGDEGGSSLRSESCRPAKKRRMV
ncbi:hypothetical protein M406DRAFT_354935 [Cryphonectria parasitica EP155]|uniref:Uncharacterized protein n=1 Tax=Cryphonectria parasitica (strain ATCC 38755 / EP155) TaxID=660469 RepID=A0A9P4Y933_CRYP1|nr:uncharacterized protein M406DRAFT_354935 [Cryphonectria parasitica EP155]KAF3768597.1 hypothetical protein M406DRAFT_354935 [Cryphonectria parasitica EP155]